MPVSFHTQTFAYTADKDELDAISAALDALQRKDYVLASKILIARHDVLTAAPKLKTYDPRDP